MGNGNRGIPNTQKEIILPRVGAFVVDHVLSVVVSVVLGVGLAVATGLEPMVYVGALVGLLGYFIAFEGWRGQTPGKKLLNVVVVDVDGNPISYRQATIRNVLRLVDGLFGYALGLVVMMTNEERMRIGDYAAMTTVVRSNW